MRTTPWIVCTLAVLTAVTWSACGPGGSRKTAPKAMATNRVTEVNAAGEPVFVDDFNRSGTLGTNWSNAFGAFTVNGSAAVATSGETYAAWVGAEPPNSEVSAKLTSPIGSTWVGVFTHGTPSEPDRDHYAAYVAPDGAVHLGRRNDWSYTYLGDAGTFPSGSHVLGIRATTDYPVQISVTLDGAEIIHYDDASQDALTGPGSAGIFDYNGAGQEIDDFTIAQGPLFADDFNRTVSGGLGSNWTIAFGSFDANGTAATGTASSSYAVWNGAPNLNSSVVATLTSPIASTFVGVIARATSGEADRDHYAAYIGTEGNIHLARRNNWDYTVLADAGAFPTGTHVLGLTAEGTDPVHLSVTLDGAEVIQVDDSSPDLLADADAGSVGIFDYNGASQAIDDFAVTYGNDFADDLRRDASLGADWDVPSGAFTCTTAGAIGTVSPSYALSLGTAADATTSITLSSPINNTYVGVVARAPVGAGDRDHYAAYVAPDGNVHLARRNDWNYTYLADGDAFPSGTHTLGLSVDGTDPVQVSLTVDGVEWLHYDDTDASRLTDPGEQGIFDYNGSSQLITDFGVKGHIFRPFHIPYLIVAPVPPRDVEVGDHVRIVIHAFGLARPLTFSASGIPSGSNFDSDQHTFSWTPSSADVGPHYMSFTVTDANNHSKTVLTRITVVAVSGCSHVSTFEDGLDMNAAPKMYVSANGSGTACTQAAPCDISYAVPNAAPGTSVLMLAGTYGHIRLDDVNPTGTATTPLWIGGLVGQEPTIQNPPGSSTPPYGGGEALRIAKARYLILHDINIQNTGDQGHGINIDDGAVAPPPGDDWTIFDDETRAHDIIIERVHFANIPKNRLPAYHDSNLNKNVAEIVNCIKASGINHFYLLDNDFGICGRGNGVWYGSTWIPEGGDAVDLVGCHHGVIARNTFSGRTAVQAKGGSLDIEIRGNTSEFNQAPGDWPTSFYNLGNSTGDFFRPSLHTAPDHYEAKDIRLIANLMISPAAVPYPQPMVGGQGVRMIACVDCLVANNTIVNSVDQHFFINQDTQDVCSGGTVYDSFGNPISAPCDATQGGRVFNNIFYFDFDQLFEEQGFLAIRPSNPETPVQDNWGSWTFADNQWFPYANAPNNWAPSLNGLTDAGQILTDPLFAVDDYSLQPASDGVGSGAGEITLPELYYLGGNSANDALGDIHGDCYADPPNRGAFALPTPTP